MTDADTPNIVSINRRPARIEVGECFNRWTVIGEADPAFNAGGYRMRMLLCRCDCGTEKAIRPAGLRYGSTKSCGCLQKEVVAKRCTTHGGTKGYQRAQHYNAWKQMRSRCHCKENSRYSYYGGRGIYVCKRWFDNFAAFIEDMGPRPDPTYSIERIDNDGPYSPDNCRWASKKDQARNTRRTRLVDAGQGQEVLAAVAERAGVHESVIRNRIARGWEPDNIADAALTSKEASRRALFARWADRMETA